MIYIFKCGHKATDPARKDNNHSRYLACPECGERVGHIITQCQICQRQLISPAGNSPKRKCEDHKEMATQAQAAKMLGVSVSTIINLRRRGELVPNVKIGNKGILTRSQVRAYKDSLHDPDEDEAPEHPGCDKYNCAHRCQCLGTPQFYQPCSKYQPEYEAGDFLRTYEAPEDMVAEVRA